MPITGPAVTSWCHYFKEENGIRITGSCQPRSQKSNHLQITIFLFSVTFSSPSGHHISSTEGRDNLITILPTKITPISLASSSDHYISIKITIFLQLTDHHSVHLNHHNLLMTDHHNTKLDRHNLQAITIRSLLHPTLITITPACFTITTPTVRKGSKHIQIIQITIRPNSAVTISCQSPSNHHNSNQGYHNGPDHTRSSQSLTNHHPITINSSLDRQNLRITITPIGVTITTPTTRQGSCTLALFANP